MTNLGKLEKVEVREVWVHEAHDFSTWLVKPENLALLSEAVEIDIQPLGTEVGIGRFRIDILAEDGNTGYKIIIENQLEATNHDHLGKVITYAAGHDAKYLIWIVKDVLDEHRKAIEWLNEHLDDEIRCFLIRIEVWRIGDSKPAPRFDVVEVKNDWAATVKSVSVSGEFSETKLKQLDYWTQLSQYIQNKDFHFKLRSPSPQHWLDFSTGSSLAHISLTINSRENRLGCELYISKDKALFSYLMTIKEVLSSELKCDLNWIDAEKASRIVTFRSEKQIFDSHNQNEQFEWMYQMVLKFRQVLGRHIQEYQQSLK